MSVKLYDGALGASDTRGALLSHPPSAILALPSINLYFTSIPNSQIHTLTSNGRSPLTRAMEHHIRLAQSLPPRLLNFFKRYPPPQLSGLSSSASQLESFSGALSEGTLSQSSDVVASAPSTTPSSIFRNPFLAYRHPITQAFHGPPISLRRQSELIKLATQHNVLPLMPYSPKSPEVREQKRLENGLRVQGTGMGKRVKGKLWERTLKGRLENRRKALEGMPEMVRLWKERGHGRGWKKWPSGKHQK